LIPESAKLWELGLDPSTPEFCTETEQRPSGTFETRLAALDASIARGVADADAGE
jgi:hypothetical protein